MRGRPKLVEEGKPIYGPGSDDAPTDHDMDEHHDHVAEATSTSHKQPSQSSGTGMSSLQRAALSSCGGGRKYTKPRPKIGGSSYVIGGAGEQAARGGDNHFSFAAMHHAHHVEEHSFTIPSQHPPAHIQPQHANAASWSHSGYHHHAAPYTIQQPTEYQQASAGYHHVHTYQPQNYHSQAQSMDHHAMDHAMDHEMIGEHDTTDHSQQHATPLAASHPQHHQNANAYLGSYHPTPTQHTHQTTSFTIGGGNSEGNSNSNYAEDYSLEKIERMEGVEDQGIKPPLVVLDGANVAYAYAASVVGLEHVSSLAVQARKPEPDSTGIQVACRYFRHAGLRVLVVLPTSWFRSKPRPRDTNRSSSMMETPQLEILHDLKAQGLLVAAPPTDDDDAYALLIARREQARAQGRNGQGPGFVLSNDMFRDAAARDPTGELKQWLTTGSDDHGPGRISFAFCDMGTMDDHGDRVLDFIPNPRHPLVAWVESEHRRVNSI
jgi:hypothetical protein